MQKRVGVKETGMSTCQRVLHPRLASHGRGHPDARPVLIVQSRNDAFRRRLVAVVAGGQLGLVPSDGVGHARERLGLLQVG
jgi:hypothetical protein